MCPWKDGSVCIFFERPDRKTNADNFNAFRSYNYPPLAHAFLLNMIFPKGAAEMQS